MKARKKQGSSTSPKETASKQQEQLLVGIDFGTTHSSVGVYHMGRPEIIANDHGLRSTPSVVSVLASGEAMVGDSAVNQAAKNRANTVFNLKTLLGLPFEDEDAQGKIAGLPFTCVEDRSTTPSELAALISVGDPPQQQPVSLVDLASHILKSLRTVAESYVGLRATGCVLTYPPEFSEPQIQALGRAAKKAGLKVAGLVSEPCAVALAHELDGPEGGCQEEAAAGTGRDCSRNILVFDWGGGGVSATVLSEQGGVFSQLAHRSDKGCGGPEFINRLKQFCAQDFSRKYRMEVSESRKAVAKLTKGCEQTLGILSISSQASVEVDSLMDGIDLRVPISRARFEDLISDLLPRGVICVNEVLAECNLTAQDIQLVLPSGGLVQMPRIQSIIQNLFQTSTILSAPGKPEEVVALGATWQAYHLSNQHPDTEIGEEFPTLPESIGILDPEGNFIAALLKGCFLPASTILEVQCPANDSQTPVSYIIKVVENEELKNELANVVFKDVQVSEASAIILQFNLGISGGLEITAEHNVTKSKEKVLIGLPS
mmetsp:Transcript_34140/g.45134  ORF Transcript_34140/g.45134 Transcript_34140/m.45134 type:complete len:544 (-) Transcript_34140:249-1880(-)